MPRKTAKEVLAEAKRALEIARGGHEAKPQPGIRGDIFGPEYHTRDTEPETQPPPVPPLSIDARLRELNRLYNSGQIDREDFERRKAEILQEI